MSADFGAAVWGAVVEKSTELYACAKAGYKDLCEQFEVEDDRAMLKATVESQALRIASLEEALQAERSTVQGLWNSSQVKVESQAHHITLLEQELEISGATVQDLRFTAQDLRNGQAKVISHSLRQRDELSETLKRLEKALLQGEKAIQGQLDALQEIDRLKGQKTVLVRHLREMTAEIVALRDEKAKMDKIREYLEERFGGEMTLDRMLADLEREREERAESMRADLVDRENDTIDPWGVGCDADPKEWLEETPYGCEEEDEVVVSEADASEEFEKVDGVFWW